MLKRLIATLVVAWPMLTFSQTSISGVVNSYYKVTSVSTSQNSVQLSSTSGLAVYDKVMIIQMKGATITTTNTSSFGNITNINGTGDYEINTVCSVAGNTVYLINSLLHNYATTDKVQLVRIPTYAAATVTGALTASPWDSAAGTGGVLAINVTNGLTLQAAVSASGQGYAGGKFLMSSGTCFDNFTNVYYTDPTSLSPQFGGYKGEGIADIQQNQRGARGPLGNGGGGGENHNTAGGGGANAGAGGAGGDNTSGSGCSSDYPGLGGNAISSNTTKLFFGGGGGAGHGNNTAQSGGGAGGGIVYIQAGSLTSNGNTISADGANGSSTFGDGASGGGGGGTVIMKVTTYADAASITAKGGNGGQVDNENLSGRCYGDGGGGGGGTIYFTGASQAGSSVAGGTKGGKINSSGCGPTDAHPSENGAAGTIGTSYSVAQSTTASSSCTVVALPVRLISFQAVLRNRSAYIDWEVTGAEDAVQYILQKRTTNGWTDLRSIPASATTSYYQLIDANLLTGNYQYRLLIIENTGARIYSDIRSVSLKEMKVPAITLSPNPASKEVLIIGQESGSLQIFDMAGRLLVKRNLTSGNMIIHQDVSQWQPGIYVVQWNGMTEKLVIKRD